MKYPKPYGENILVKRKKSNHGIIITSDTKNEGEIVAVGDGTPKHPMTLTVGQNVMFEGYGMSQIPIDWDKDNQYILMPEGNVQLILD